MAIGLPGVEMLDSCGIVLSKVPERWRASPADGTTSHRVPSWAACDHAGLAGWVGVGGGRWCEGGGGSDITVFIVGSDIGIVTVVSGIAVITTASM